ncbi:MAG: phenylacetyl-CoA:acceptor oxidoreductase [Burkholderiales bacterium]|nr:phenylacetyl-CoA:acceptor oxidoreductase [Burkholderiales bacterium]
MRVGDIQQRSWDWRAAANFILGGASSALLGFAALAVVSGDAAQSRWTILAGMAGMGLGLAFVWLEIGRPWRALNVFFHPATSWMTREAMVAVLCMVLGAVWILRGGEALAVALALAAFTFLFCQARILTEAKGIPSWRIAQAGWLVATTGLVEGASLLLLAAYLTGSQSSLAGLEIATICLVLVLVRTIALEAYRRALAGSDVARGAARVFNDSYRLLAGFSSGLPAFLLVIALWSPAAWPAGVAGALAAVGGGWVTKYLLVTRAARVQGYAFGALRTGHPLGLRRNKNAREKA